MTATIPTIAIVASRARVAGRRPRDLRVAAAGAAVGDVAVVARSGSGSRSVAGSGSNSPIVALPCSCPHSGQVQSVVPGRMWNRTLQLSHAAKIQGASHAVHV